MTPRDRTLAAPSLLTGERRLEVRVRESSRARRLRITVSPDRPPELVVPTGTSRREIDRMLREHAGWVSRKTAELRATEARHPVLGLERPGVVWLNESALEVVHSPSTRPVAKRRGHRVRVGGSPAMAGEALERWYRREARELLSRAVLSEAVILGVSPGKVSVRDQRTRWGSCSPSGALSFSWRLLLAPSEVLDYVVVHELCHLQRLDHSKRFWALVERARPDWKAQARWLREHGPEISRYDVNAALPAESSNVE